MLLLNGLEIRLCFSSLEQELTKLHGRVFVGYDNFTSKHRQQISCNFLRKQAKSSKHLPVDIGLIFDSTIEHQPTTYLEGTLTD